MLSIHADTAARQRPSRSVQHIELGAALKTPSRQDAFIPSFSSSATYYLVCAPKARQVTFAAAVRKAWGSNRNGGHCHFRQLKQQGWPQCAKDFSSHHGLPNWGSTSLWPRRITNRLEAWACATCMYLEPWWKLAHITTLLFCAEEPRSAGKLPLQHLLHRGTGRAACVYLRAVHSESSDHH